MAFLNELIFLMDRDGFVARTVRARAAFSPRCRLEAELAGEKNAFARRPRGLLVKAATYHGLALRRSGGRWRARVVLDI